MKRYVICTMAVSAMVFAGCGSKKDANEQNFKVAIQTYLDTVYPKCYFVQNFPAVPSGFDLHNEKGKLAALVKAGLVSVKEEPHEETTYAVKKTSIKPTFYLTDEGKKFYKSDVDKTLGGKPIGGFCAGKAEVKDVPQFTEPSDVYGQKISLVNYTYVVNDLPSWAKSPELQSALKGLKPDFDSKNTPIKASDTLVLTNNGWVHERIFRK